jgi:hypothetical protein
VHSQHLRQQMLKNSLVTRQTTIGRKITFSSFLEVHTYRVNERIFQKFSRHEMMLYSFLPDFDTMLRYHLPILEGARVSFLYQMKRAIASHNAFATQGSSQFFVAQHFRCTHVMQHTRILGLGKVLVQATLFTLNPLYCTYPATFLLVNVLPVRARA